MGSWEPGVYSQEECKLRCKGKKFAGLQARHYCFCSDTPPPASLKTPENQCNKQCTRGPGTCGATWRMSVFALAPFYKGCYQDNSSARIFGPWLPRTTPYSTAACVAECSNQGFVYAGMQAGDYCFCSNKPPTIQLPNSACNTACRHGPGTCGGSSKMSVYTTECEHECAESRCGKDRADADSKCGNDCILNWTPSGCPPGETCFAGLDVSLNCCTSSRGDIYACDRICPVRGNVSED